MRRQRLHQVRNSKFAFAVVPSVAGPEALSKRFDLMALVPRHNAIGQSFKACRQASQLISSIRKPRLISQEALYRPRFLGHRIEPYAA
jgi:hypothetical protein